MVVLFLYGFLTFLAPSPSCIAQENTDQRASAKLEDTLQKRGDLSLQDATMEKALIAIGATWNVNIVVGKDISGTISCVYHQTPLREVLDAILLANGYSYRAVGDSIVVQKANEVGSANPLFESAAIVIKHGELEELVEAARLLSSAQGQVRSLPSARSILVLDYKDRVQSIRQFVADMEKAASNDAGAVPAGSYKQLTVAYFHTQYIPVDNAREPISSVLSQVGRVSTMPAENRLVVVDYASNIDVVRRVLEKIDRPRPQVRITALIYDISLEDAEELGFNWNEAQGKGRDLDGNGQPNQFVNLETQTLTPFGAASNGTSITFQSLTSNFDLNAVALLLQSAGDSRLLADPTVTVVDNEQAEWRSVSEIPFQQITQSELGGQIGTTAFKPVGITLRVKAAVAADETVEMEVEPEFSRLAGFTENDNQPIVDTRSARTIVRVANRQTLVIGGLRQRSDTGEFNGVPFLKDIKYVGNLFRSRVTNVRESELIVFIMPEIVDFNQRLVPREYLAQETVGCRLAKIPKAEGCPNYGCKSGWESDRLMPLPQVDGEVPVYSEVYSENTDSNNPQRMVFRQPFDDRYRAPGASNTKHDHLIESSKRSSKRPPSAKENFMQRMITR